MFNTIRCSFVVIGICFFTLNVSGQKIYTDEIKGAAVALYNSFGKTQHFSGQLTFNDTARLQWNNLPVGLRSRVGTSIGAMTIDQRKLVHRILSASLSSQGYLKATSILHLDDLLDRYYDSVFYKKEIPDTTYSFLKSLLWSHKNYYFAFFGNPSDKVWGYKIEGHHLSVNFTFVNDELAVTPFFVGTDPAEYPSSEYAGWRVLGQEEDLGLKLIKLLTPAQQKKATHSMAVPEDIITSAESGKRLVDNWGILGSEMTIQQKTILQYIIREFVFNLEYEKAVIEYDKIIKAGIDKIYFGWIGPYDEFVPHYFVLNGPTFIIEFDNNGGPGNGSNHVHAIWREKGNEYGEDLLKKHYQKSKHKKEGN
jgi:hypothetical protein